MILVNTDYITGKELEMLSLVKGSTIQLSFDEGAIHTCDYLETESYQVTEMFINNRKYFLKRLLEDSL